MRFDDKIPIYLQIKNYLYRQIINNDIEPGQKIPSVRQLAEEVTANSNTVQRAVSEMVSEGIIESQRGKGNFVTTDVDMIEQLRARLVQEQIALAYQNLHELDLSDEEIVTAFQKFIARGEQND